jgi:alpha-beta hydrolase superfamily lysophospholipase
VKSRRWLRWTAGVLAAVLVVFVFGWVPYWASGLVTTRRFRFPDRENAGLTPASFSLQYQEIAFEAADGVTLKGWWVPAAEPRGSVVLVHGLNRSRIEMVKKVPFLHGQGWNALLFDVRHHGESGGDVSTLGYLERRDVHAAIAEARRRSAVPVVVWGVSLGAVASMLAVAEDPSVAGVVSDSSYRNLRDTVTHHLRLFRGFRWWLRIVPQWPVAEEVVFWIGRRGGFDPDAADVRAAAARLGGRPALFVANSGDQRMPSEIAFELKEAAGGNAKVLVVPGKSHGGAYRDATVPYETAVAGLLEEAVSEVPEGRQARAQEGGGLP